jgi:predicted ATPase/class 3 adenylate cyclase
VVQEPEILTVLFTDLVGSTSMLSALGDDAADEVRRSHFSILRRAIAEHRGSEVKSVGDGLMVAFTSAREAVSCAAEMQQAVSAQKDCLELRVGIDAGEPIHDRGDLYGMPVVVARRLCDAASGGQVLVSDVVRMLSERRLEMALEAVGPMRLKGVDEPVLAHAVRWRAAAPKPALPAFVARAADRPFVARTAELGRLRQAWEAARGGEGRFVALAGEPGIGKTSLAANFARNARADGATVLVGRCHPEALVPYEPFVEALRQLPREALRERARVLSRLMAELDHGDAPTFAPDDPAQRHVLFDAVAGALSDAAARRPLVLVLDDLHWGDQPTLLLLRHVARSNDAVPLLVLATYRTTEVTATQRVVDALTDIGREISVERLTVRGLDDRDVANLIAALDGRRSSAVLASAMHRDTAGNPLFVDQLLRHLGDTGVLVERSGELTLEGAESRLGVPDTVSDLVARRLSALAPGTVGALHAAAVIGRSFDDGLVAAACEDDEQITLDSLDAAGAAGLIEEVAPGRHTFVHALVREAIYERIGSIRRARLHRRLAVTLASAPDADPAELAHHYLAGGDRANGVASSIAAAQRALAQLAYEDAAVHYQRALAAVGDTDPERRCDLLLALADARAREGATSAAKRSYREAAGIAEARGMPEHLARAALGYGGRLLWEVSRDDPDLVPLLERALDAIGEDDSPLRVRLLARLGGGPLRDDHDPTRRRAIAREALAAARRLGDAPTLTYGLAGYIAAHHSPDGTVEQAELSTELIDIALRAGDLERAIEAYEHRAAARTELGDIAGANADVDAMAVLAADLRQAPQDWFVAERRAVRALHEGRLADAEALVADALRIGRDAMQWSAAVTHVLQLVVLRRLQGRLAEVEPAARAAAEEYATSYPLCRCAHLHVLAELGRVDEARAGLDALAPHGFAALDFDETWLAAVAFLAEAAYALGEPDHAATLYERLAPYADRVALSTPEISVGCVSRYLGLLAAACGRAEAAGAHFEDAVAYDTRTGARPYVALALENHAALTGDHDLLARAIEAYRALGMDELAQRAARLLR